MMARNCFRFATILALVFAFSSSAFPQVSAESAVKGNLFGSVLDPSGAFIPGAKVTIIGPTGQRTMTTDTQGRFQFLLLLPGIYSLKVEKQGFKKADLRDIQVLTNQGTVARVKLETGTVTETVEVTAGAVAVDTASTTSGSNLSNDFYEKVAVPRNVSGIFYIAPGVSDSGKAGNANPSISGGSGLENLYVADGVDITDTAFGGLGIFSRNYGSVGTGINLSFVKEVEVKTAGYEPQYGKTTGGVVQIVTKSGSNAYHGAITLFGQPRQFEADRLNPDQFKRFNHQGNLVHVSNYDITGEFGGFIPGFKDRLFFFTSFNPSVGERIVEPAAGSLLFGRNFTNRVLTYNYAAKLTAKLSDKHQIEGSVYGDPATTSTTPFRRLDTDSTTSFSRLDYGSRNTVVRYNGSLTPTWLINASATWAHTHFNEGGFNNSINEVIDTTQTGFDDAGVAFPLNVTAVMRGQFVPAGLGFVENTRTENYGANIDTTKIFHAAGEHTFSIGYRMERPFYDGSRTDSGPKVPLPAANADGNTLGFSSDYTAFANNPNLSLANYAWSLFIRDPALACTLCPLMNVPGAGQVPVYLKIFRSEFGLNPDGSKDFLTSGRYHAAYANDSWSPNKYVTLNMGLRWEQQRLVGQNSNYTFTDNWSPRIGVSVDPFGDRKNKIFANFGRYTYAIPLDLAERSLTNELDMFSLRTAPAFTIDSSGNRIVTLNQFGTVTPVIDAAHVLNFASGGIARHAGVSTESGEAIHTGTRMSYLDEFTVGAEHEFPAGVVASVKYIHRDLKRIVEDTGGISPEAANAGVTQQFSITNVNAATDIFTNPQEFTYASDANGTPLSGSLPPQCDPNLFTPVIDTFGNLVPPGGACFADNGLNGQPAGSLAPDGIPDGFVNPQRLYWAVEMEVNKSFSKNWLLRTNWRIAKLVGNFEGAFRNDNGQTDPSISSLFDFTPGEFGLLGDQFKPGVLNTDRRHIVNAFFSYYVDHGALKGLTLGPGVQFETGIPINDLKAHPVYLNAGEVPVNGRGSLGRTPLSGTVDLHAEYSHPVTERTSLHLGVDLFNIANAKRQLFVDQNEDLQFGQPNADFKKPANFSTSTGDAGTAFQAPFSARVMLKFVF
jgi:Carboxypeptidase regulatory-like domain/TonB-dependent Receptor Plug Domain